PFPLVGEGGADESPRRMRGCTSSMFRPLTPTLSRCSDRGHGGRVFGDIVDTFGPLVEGPDVDGCNHLGSEDDVKDAILDCWPERDGLATEGLGKFDGATEEADVTALLDAAHDVARSIFEGRDGLDVAARARLIAACGDSEFERLVRSLRIVDIAPALESARGGGNIGEGWNGQQFGLEAAVEALVLAHGLRMIGPRMADPDALLDQPNAKRSERAARAIAPRRTIVGDQPFGQAVAADCDDQLLLDRLGPLVGASRKRH